MRRLFFSLGLTSIILCSFSTMLMAMSFEEFTKQTVNPAYSQKELLAICNTALQKHVASDAIYASFVYAVRSGLRLKNKDLELALADATLSIDNNPSDCSGYLARSSVLLGQGNLVQSAYDMKLAAILTSNVKNK